MSPSEKLQAILGNLISVTSIQGMSEAEAAEHIANALQNKYELVPRNGSTTTGEPFEENPAAGTELIEFGSMDGIEAQLKRVLSAAKKAFAFEDMGGDVKLEIEVAGPVQRPDVKISYSVQHNWDGTTKGKDLKHCWNECFRRAKWNHRNKAQIGHDAD